METITLGKLAVVAKSEVGIGSFTLLIYFDIAV
jgi:hypothetical protein